MRKINKPSVIVIILLISCLTGCAQENKNNTRYEKPGYHFPYRIAEPARSWMLPATLVEISGLSFIDSQRFACVQDESATIFIYNLHSGEVEKKIAFGDPGDYEGIEIIENDAWVLKNDGTLYRVTEYLTNTGPEVKKYSTALSKMNDTEGLAYDPVHKILLISCKESPFLAKEKESGFKAIYGFHIETGLLDETPLMLINTDTVSYYKNYKKATAPGEKNESFTDASKSDKPFKPSGIAIQPATGDLYILGSVGKLLLVYSGKGELLAITKLDGKLFRQPEGICFSPEGMLYIASEGDGMDGMIFKFEPIN